MKILATVVVACLVVLGAAAVISAQYGGGGGGGEYPGGAQTPAPPARAQAGDVRTQLKTAITHAGFAGGGDTMSYVQQHLGHALNCLEGTQGKNFNASWGHVCQGQGNGILTDLKSAQGGGSFMMVAQSADGLAVDGLKNRDLAAAKNAAKGVAALLGVIGESMK